MNWLIEQLMYKLGKKRLDKKTKADLDDLDSAVKRSISLVEDLLKVSRIQLGKLEAEAEPADISKEMEELSSEMTMYAKAKQHELSFENKVSGGAGPQVAINKKLLHNIIMNLASNAVEYSPAGTIIKITLEQTDGFVKVSVSNNGPDIPKDEQARIFEKFYRTKAGRSTKPEGTGLGLFIVKTFAEKMGGQVGFRSAPGEDTVFWFTLPLQKKQ